ncbi:MAG: beta-ketoacyl-ACP synthase III [Anaerolineae bacterium]|jgi:3-oxoacyl-[acyl-carrier-protein] synthase-3|nr:ketoacyl-ACP synthase III [Chloroflexota bacterium]
MAESRRHATVIGWGTYAPEHVVTNADLAATLDTSDEWIRSRTGIERRHVAAGEATAAMAIEAARAALRVADADPYQIGLVLVATMTPDYPSPSTACLVQHALGAAHAGAVDLNAGCSGFCYALALANAAILSGEHDMVLVIGADTMSSIVDKEDRATAVLFGDGAGALLLGATNGPAGVLATWLGADGSGAEMLIVPAGGSALPASAETVARRQHYLTMDGNQVFRFAVRMLPRAVEQVLGRVNLPLSEVDWIIPHQANRRIIEAAAQKLEIPSERFYLNLQEYGNTSAASIPLAIGDAVADGSLLPGQHVVLVGFGAGLTWGAVLLRWGTGLGTGRTTAYRYLWRWLLYRWAAVQTLGRRLAARVRGWRLRRPRPDDPSGGGQRH